MTEQQTACVVGSAQISIPIRTGFHNTLVRALSSHALEGAPASCNGRERRALWAMRARSKGRDLSSALFNAAFAGGAMCSLVGLTTFISSSISMAGGTGSPVTLHMGLLLTLAAVPFGYIMNSSRMMDNGWAGECRLAHERIRRHWGMKSEKWDANELFSFLRIFDDSSAWKRRHAAEPLLSEVDNLSLLRLAWLVNATSIDKLRNIVLDGDARELIARAISAMSDAADTLEKNAVHDGIILVTGRSLQEGIK